MTSGCDSVVSDVCGRCEGSSSAEDMVCCETDCSLVSSESRWIPGAACRCDESASYGGCPCASVPDAVWCGGLVVLEDDVRDSLLSGDPDVVMLIIAWSDVFPATEGRVTDEPEGAVVAEAWSGETSSGCA